MTSWSKAKLQFSLCLMIEIICYRILLFTVFNTFGLEIGDGTLGNLRDISKDLDMYKECISGKIQTWGSMYKKGMLEKNFTV